MQQFDRQNSASCISHSFAILLIPFLFLVGLVLAYLGIFPINVEAHTFGIVAFIFVVFVFFVKHNANYAVCHMKGSFFNMEEDLQAALRENALTIMGKTKSTLHVNDFITEYYQDIRNDNFARVAPSVFPMLGILGTFIAIALSMPDFTVKDLGALDREISILLSGIGTAFYASIYGIMLSLIWTYFEKRGIAKVDKQIFDLERLYGQRVWKRSELIKHEHMQSELKDQQIVQTLKETFNMDFIKELNDQYLKNFTTIIHDTTNSFTKLTVHMQEASSELRDTLENIHHRQASVDAVAVMEKNIEGFNENAQNLQKSMERFDGSVDHTFEKIDEELGQAVDKLATFARIISEQNEQILENMATSQQQEK
ncbi:MAG: MotA/TolQ/ExbB proton channel family protein [Sulfurovum sp.]|uniref:MotA/TolQ/ExbB proton channel family protein n=1 Tax=Sulfurovum sp. TaxID=1969726 RepID=UPI002867B7BA|nr:MotA/TolQ/ExbB proton channel family protein [Sulfurovum sp.]MCO4844971.1 MotA/TolQ/ExbB proton channel family protein [Sulfurovum sp.]